jgi:hypothetical protein
MEKIRHVEYLPRTRSLIRKETLFSVDSYALRGYVCLERNALSAEIIKQADISRLWFKI